MSLGTPENSAILKLSIIIFYYYYYLLLTKEGKEQESALEKWGGGGELEEKGRGLTSMVPTAYVVASDLQTKGIYSLCIVYDQQELQANESVTKDKPLWGNFCS